MRTLAILSRKGGTGKTTVALHMAVAASLSARRAVVADIDPQKSAMEWYEERMKIRDWPVVSDVRVGTLFTKRVEAARTGHDLMIIDTRPSTDLECAEAVRWADVCAIVVRPCFFDIKAIERTVDLVFQMNKRAFFLINQAPSQRFGEEPKVVLETLEKLNSMRFPVAPVGLRYRASYQNAVKRGLTAQEIDPNSYAASEIMSLWSYVDQQLWPSMARPTDTPSLETNSEDMALVG